jgi:hypothetical protein
MPVGTTYRDNPFYGFLDKSKSGESAVACIYVAPNAETELPCGKRSEAGNH